ncbi:importin subunit beta-1 [Acrasis kona]|uniref:Importin subunit beta-1 n=1 Tax=Acrasis kona TaxID=1008807 RepID=A0AAW2ZG89_9EUKA
MDITQILLAANGNDKGERDRAHAVLTQAQQTEFQTFLVALANELANETKPSLSRQTAGILLKNAFSTKDLSNRQHVALQWINLPEEIKQQIRAIILSTLHSPAVEIRQTAAQVLAQIAGIDLPNNQWPEVVTTLLHNVQQNVSPYGVEASLSTLGYICEETKSLLLSQQSDLILNAVALGLAQQQPERTKEVAIQALLNALEFVRANFNQNQERDQIMRIICDATQSQNVVVRKTAFECIVEVAHLYYATLTPYMVVLYQITLSAAENDVEEVALQAIEFWSTLAEDEADIQDSIEMLEDGEKTDLVHLHLVESALKPLCALIVKLLTRQREDCDGDEMTVSNSAATCLSLVSTVARDKIIFEVMPFIENNIKSADWRLREAATLCFCAIQEGTSTSKMSQYIKGSIPLLINQMKDANETVKDTTIFTLGTIAKFHPDPIINGEHLNIVLNAIGIGMRDEPRISAKACWTLHNIAEAFEDQQSEDQQTYALSADFGKLVQALFFVTDRGDVSENNLRINAYEALSALINSATRDLYEFLDQQVVSELLSRLERTLTMREDEQEVSNIQGLLCAVLQNLTIKLSDRVRKHADRMMTLYLSVFQKKSNSSVHEETLLCVGSLAGALSFDFARYMDHFKPFLFSGLSNQQEKSVCNVSINVLSDLCTALGDKIKESSDDIMTILFTNIQAAHVDKNIKSRIISLFGDIALAIQGDFEKYITPVGQILRQAGEAHVNDQNRTEEMIDYVDLLRENILDAYIGILQGFKKQNQKAFDPCVDQLVGLIRMIAQDSNVCEPVFKNAVIVIGDLANVYGARIGRLLNQDFIKSLVDQACNSEEKDTKRCGLFTRKQLKKISV